MKLTSFSVSILLDEITAMEKAGEIIKEPAKVWLHHQEQRKKYGWVDADYTALVRSQLEKAIEEYRQALARVYDTMGDRGLAQFDPLPNSAGNGEAVNV
jgi:hypothetical protein